MKLKIKAGDYEQEIDFSEDDEVDIRIEEDHHVWVLKRRKKE